MTRLMALQFKVVYRKSKENFAADALSIMNHLFVLQAVSVAQPVWLQEVLNSYTTDSTAQEILTRLAVNNLDQEGFSLDNGLIRYKDKVWIGNNSALQTKLISALHSSVVGGHSGAMPTYYRLKQLFSWKGQKRNVISFVKKCLICQQAKHELTHPTGLLA
jgi:hypothetical protein